MTSRERAQAYPPANVSSPKERRPTGDVRNGSSSGHRDGGMSRAEKFEDEKRRIIQSCFSKQDTDGSCMFRVMPFAVLSSSLFFLSSRE